MPAIHLMIDNPKATNTKGYNGVMNACNGKATRAGARSNSPTFVTCNACVHHAIENGYLLADMQAKIVQPELDWRPAVVMAEDHYAV